MFVSPWETPVACWGMDMPMAPRLIRMASRFWIPRWYASESAVARPISSPAAALGVYPLPSIPPWARAFSTLRPVVSKFRWIAAQFWPMSMGPSPAAFSRSGFRRGVS